MTVICSCPLLAINPAAAMMRGLAVMHFPSFLPSFLALLAASLFPLHRHVRRREEKNPAGNRKIIRYVNTSTLRTLTNNSPPQAPSTATHIMPPTIHINLLTRLQEAIQEEGVVGLQAVEVVDEAEGVLTPLI